MSPIPIAGPAVEPVTLAEAKAYLRLDGDDEDAVVASLVAAARQVLECATRRAFIAQTWRVRLDRWPEGRVVALPLAPVLAVAAVRVSPGAGPALVLDPALWRLETDAEPPRLVADPAAPDPGIPSGGIEIDATYGFGPAPADVPAPLRLAIQRLAARWFERRGDEDGEGVMPAEILSLVAPFLRPRIA
ncbi:head-tail connector protein [Enterovirga aerilata]|uniref:PhiE125 gp8 family phage protein n=1 Tax=Enterovirga aerilata TaxID=2730920 RepID=A0A849HZZ1_9HYPH|nr:head-tail connector protein [Enterovirga sp. DB1703]NNM72652.1 hypothetical protein [Enterovirga sp. DB1703]